MGTSAFSDLKNEFISQMKGKEVLHCVSISKHCCKLGRKTIPPWFALVYMGYSPATSLDKYENWRRSQSLRLALQTQAPKSNPLKALIPDRGDKAAFEEWMSPKGWNTAGWQEECEVRKQALLALCLWCHKDNIGDVFVNHWEIMCRCHPASVCKIFETMHYFRYLLITVQLETKTKDMCNCDAFMSYEFMLFVRSLSSHHWRAPLLVCNCCMVLEYWFQLLFSAPWTR